MHLNQYAIGNPSMLTQCSVMGKLSATISQSLPCLALAKDLFFTWVMGGNTVCYLLLDPFSLGAISVSSITPGLAKDSLHKIEDFIT